MNGEGRRVLLLGASGTIGLAVAGQLRADGYDPVCLMRADPLRDGCETQLAGIARLVTDFADPSAVRQAILRAGADALISCMASRTGAPEDAWAIDYRAHSAVLKAAQAARIRQMVLLSAICVQKPRLAFQRAKLAFEAELIASGLTYSIVRPTAYFKSLSGQVARVRGGKSYLLFGDGRGTACKPISNRDLARYLVACLSDATLQNRVLPIGGPGPAVTPRAQGAYLFAKLGLTPRFRQVPVRLIRGIASGLALAGRLSPAASRKAEFARIAEYYATESMLVWDAVAERYDADATPEFGRETLWDHYDHLLRGEGADDRGAHALF
ncbi:MAG: NAD(P)H-binding protein [Pseudomonadota bacterium]